MPPNTPPSMTPTMKICWNIGRLEEFLQIRFHCKINIRIIIKVALLNIAIY